MKRFQKIINFTGGKITASYNQDAANEPAEILVYDDIGVDPWDGGGLTAKAFNEALACIPRNRDIVLRVNSRGGDVSHGMAIKSMLDEWPGKITAKIDGIAASTASWMILAADEVQAPKASQMFIHDAIGFFFGNAAEALELVKNLDKTSQQIAEMYAEKTGKSADECRDAMRANTLFTGQEAKDFGLVDTLTDEKPVRNFAEPELTAMRNTLAAIYNSAPAKGAANPPTHTEIIMNREQLMALLAEHGVTVNDKMTDEQLQTALKQSLTNKKSAAPAPGADDSKIVALQNQLNQLTEANNTAKKLRITNTVDGLIAADKLPAALKDKAINRALLDEEYLNELAALPAKPPGAEPVHSNIVIGEDVRNVIGEMNRNIGSRANLKAGRCTVENAAQRSSHIAGLFASNREKLIGFYNTNNIDADLKRVLVLQEGITAFSRRVLPLRLFATAFQNTPLQGTDEVVVPYFPLQAAASKDFVQNDGYVFDKDTDTQSKKITVNKRKYQPMKYNSAEFRRQPFFDAVKLMQMNADKLAYDVLFDVLSVVTLANFGAAVKTIPAAGYDSDTIADIRVACNDTNWPEMGRGLIVNTAIDGALTKDPAYKLALNIGGVETIRNGKLPNLSGFGYAWLSALPENGEGLIGMAVFMSAILAAFAPVDPAEGVRNALLGYDVVTDPASGISMNYRHWGNPEADEDREIIECGYGYAVGQAGALKRFTKA